MPPGDPALWRVGEALVGAGALVFAALVLLKCLAAGAGMASLTALLEREVPKMNLDSIEGTAYSRTDGSV